MSSDSLHPAQRQGYGRPGSQRQTARVLQQPQPIALVLWPGPWAACRQRQAGQQSQTKYARGELEATGPFPLLLSPGRTVGSTVSNYKQQRFQEQSNKKSLKNTKRSGLCLSLFLLYPKLFISGTRNQVGVRKISRCHFYGPWKTKNKTKN